MIFPLLERLSINLPFFFFFLKSMMVSTAGLQVLDGAGEGKDPLGTRGCSM